MARNSLEQIVETYFVELFRTHRMLKSKEFRHSDSQEDAEPNVITIEAKQGEDLLEAARGPNGECRSKVEVTVRYRSTGATGSQENDRVGDAMQRTIRNANKYPTSAQNTPGFYLLILNEQITSSRDHTKSTRSREMVIPVQAGLIE